MFPLPCLNELTRRAGLADACSSVIDVCWTRFPQCCLFFLFFFTQTVRNAAGMRPRAAMQARQDVVAHMERFHSIFGLGKFFNTLCSSHLSPKVTCNGCLDLRLCDRCTAGTPRQEFAEYLSNMRQPGSWAGAQEVAAAADLFHVRIELTSISDGGVWTDVYSPQEVSVAHPGHRTDTPLPMLRMLLHENHFWATEPL